LLSKYGLWIGVLDSKKKRMGHTNFGGYQSMFFFFEFVGHIQHKNG
jgi:hypothetical protein